MKRRQTLSIDLPFWPGILFLIVPFIMFCFLSGGWRYLNIRPSQEWERISNEQYGFSVEYPLKWTARTFGESGNRGAEEVKLQIERGPLDIFYIAIYWVERENPTIYDAAEWGEEWIARLNEDEDRSDFIYQKLAFGDYVVDGSEAFFRRYGNSYRTFEEVYMAREDDMIIIQLYSQVHGFDRYLPDFYRIVDSFETIDDPSIK